MFNKFDLICEERFKRNVKRRFSEVLLDIVNTTPFKDPIITRRRSTTLRSGDDFFNTSTIRILD